MKISLTLSALTLTIVCFGQVLGENDILKAKQKPTGGYRTFKEFRTNSPSIKRQVNVSGRFLSVLNLRTKKYEKVKKEIYGACINDTLYILIRHPYTTRGSHFCRVDMLGRYCYALDSGTTKIYGGGRSGPPPFPYKVEYVININSGAMGILDKDLMREMLKKDPDLLEEFEHEKIAKSRYREYIKKLNVRRVEDIKSLLNQNN